MNRCLLPTLLLALLLGVRAAAPGGEPPVSFSIQLIRGSDQAKPHDPSWKSVDAKLRSQLRPVFRWKHYWEVQRASLQVEPGKSGRARLNNDREVEIRLLQAKEAEIRHYWKGKLIEKTKVHFRTDRWIMGGARENNESWFIVIATDSKGT